MVKQKNDIDGQILPLIAKPVIGSETQVNTTTRATVTSVYAFPLQFAMTEAVTEERQKLIWVSAYCFNNRQSKSLYTVFGELRF